MTYDRDRGVTDSGRIMRAFKFNLWERSFGADGQAIPFAERTPKPVIVEDIKRAGAEDTAKAAWANNGAEFGTLTPTQYGAFVSNEVKRWAAVVKASGAKLD